MQNQIHVRTCILLFAALLLLSVPGCGGSGGSTPSSDTNADLSALLTSAGALVPGFDSGTMAYSVAVDVLQSSATVTPTASDAGATITVNGSPVLSGAASQSLALAVGPNPALILVTAANGTTTKSYTVVFTRAATLAQEAYIKASNTGVSDSFGENVALSGDTLVVGARNEDSNATGVNGNEADNTATDSGAVYVFVRTAGVWTQQAYLKASNTDTNDGFGFSVAIDGDTIVVGARSESSNATGVNGNEADNTAVASGAAYVFVRTAGVWSQQAYLKASNTDTNGLFGFAVAVSGDTVVVTAPGENSNATGVNGNQADNTASVSGAAYVFTRTGAVWSQQAYLKASNTDGGDQFGAQADIDGDTVVVGANREGSIATGVNGNQADNTASGSGAVYVFTRTAGVWSQQAYLKASNTDGNDGFGAVVAVSGDTIVAGASGESSNATGVNGNQADNSALDSGAAYVFTRTAGVWSQQAYLKASNAEAGDNFSSVAVNGDTIVVGANSEDGNATGVNGNEADNSASNSGAAYVFTRTAGTWSQFAYAKASNTGANDLLGAGTFARGVAVSGGTVIAGALGERSNATGINGNQADNSAFDGGAVYVIR